MRFTLAQIEAFFWVARLGSVQQAAQQLGLAQPTVSLRVHELERTLGRKLFDRAGRGLRITREGEGLLDRAQAMLAEVDGVRERFGSNAALSGRVRIGVPETFALVCLPALLGRLAREQPALRPELVVATSAALEHDVVERTLDVAFVINPLPDPRLRLVPLGIQENTWAAAPSWGLSTTLRPADLHGLPLISNPHPAPMYRQITAWLATAGLEPQRLSLCTSVSVIAHLVAAGIGISYLPLKMIETDLTTGRLVSFPSRPPVEPARLYAVYSGADRGPHTHAVIGAAERVLAEIEFLRPLAG